MSDNYETSDSTPVMRPSVIDTATGEIIEIGSVVDSIRLARNGSDESITNMIITDYTIPSSLLKQFVTSPSEKFNPKSCLNALGLYITDTIRNKVEYKYANADWTRLEDVTVDEDLTFKNYIKGGAGPRNIYTGEFEETDDTTGGYKRVSANLGVGLGEATVLNPQFQFNKRDDPRTNPMYTKIGRIYSTKVMNNWPVVLFQPGRLKYNTGFFRMLGLGSGAGVTEAYIRSGGEGFIGKILKIFTTLGDMLSIVGTIGSAIFGGNKIVEFKQNINLYKKYVRSLWIDLAQVMGLQTPIGYLGSVRNLNLTDVLPTKHMTGGFSKYLNDQYIPFRVSTEVVGSETFSNQTTTNPLMEKLNSMAEENAEGAGQDSDPSKNIADKAVNAVKKGITGFLGNFSEQAFILSGKGRATLPDVFSSSSFQRTFTCEFNFHYPYGDRMGKFENLFLPMLTILAMGLPRQTGKMSYTSPFAIRAFVKGQIMINCGMITSITVTRGGSSNDWGPDGYPKTIKVSMDVQDMEPNISLPLAARGPARMALESMFPSSGLVEYLHSIGGLSLDEMTHRFRKKNLKRTFSVWTGSWAAKLDPENMMSSVANWRPLASIMGAFKAIDLDHYNQLGDTDRVNMNQFVDNMAENKFAWGGSVFHATALGGSPEGYKTISDERAKDDKINEAIGQEVAQGEQYYPRF